MAGQERGLHDAAQVSVRMGGTELWAGVAPHGDGADATTSFSWTCATKPLLAIGVARLVDDGVADFDDPLTRWVPEAPARWGPIRLQDLLTHTVGWVGDPGAASALSEHETALEVLLERGEVDPAWVAGTRARYSVWTGWLLLDEVLRRATGEDATAWLLREVVGPAGLLRTTLGAPIQPWAPLQHRGADRHPYVFDSPELTVRAVPGLSARGPAADLSRLFECILLDATHEGPGVLSPHATTLLLHPARMGLVDEASGTDHTWARGLAVDRRAVHPKASEGTFSHAGVASSCLGFADPALKLAAAYVTDGIPSGLASMARRFGLAQAIYADIAERGAR